MRPLLVKVAGPATTAMFVLDRSRMALSRLAEPIPIKGPSVERIKHTGGLRAAPALALAAV
jgi:hypothetical protein